MCSSDLVKRAAVGGLPGAHRLEEDVLAQLDHPRHGGRPTGQHDAAGQAFLKTAVANDLVHEGEDLFRPRLNHTRQGLPA